MRRREILGGAVMAGAWTAVQPVSAQQRGYPSQPIRFIVPFTPGGSNDVVARVLGERLSAKWGQPVVVENRPGASGNIGAEAVARAAPDGYTWLLGANQIFTTNPHLLRGSFDALRDLALVARLAVVPVVLVAHPGVPVTGVQDLVALAKGRPGTLAYPSSGVGSFQHLGLARLVGQDATHVPYRGASALLPDLLAGRVQVFAGVVNTLLPHVRSGKLKALAVMGSSRTPSLPDVPTVAEAGFPDARTDIWLSVAVPAATPRPVVEHIYDGVAEVIMLPEVRVKLAEQGIEPALQPSAELTAMVRREHAGDGELIARLGIRAD